MIQDSEIKQAAITLLVNAFGDFKDEVSSEVRAAHGIQIFVEALIGQAIANQILLEYAESLKAGTPAPEFDAEAFHKLVEKQVIEVTTDFGRFLKTRAVVH